MNFLSKYIGVLLVIVLFVLSFFIKRSFFYPLNESTIFYYGFPLPFLGIIYANETFSFDKSYIFNLVINIFWCLLLLSGLLLCTRTYHAYKVIYNAILFLMTIPMMFNVLASWTYAHASQKFILFLSLLCFLTIMAMLINIVTTLLLKHRK